MRTPVGFNSYQQFKQEFLHRPMGSWSAAVDEIADEMYHKRIEDEFETLWDPADSDDE